MPYDETIAARVRKAYGAQRRVVEKKMFGGIAFMVAGHMSCGVVGDTLMVRVGPELYQRALKRPHTREMTFTGKPMRGFVYVVPPGFDSEEDLCSWVNLSLRFVEGLPPK